MFNFIKNISSTEILVIVAILFVLFGAKILMGMARTSGKTLKEVKKVKKEFTDALNEDDEPSKN